MHEILNGDVVCKKNESIILMIFSFPKFWLVDLDSDTFLIGLKRFSHRCIDEVFLVPEHNTLSNFCSKFQFDGDFVQVSG